ncbi:MAG: hypothetical protein U1D30_23445 [Planctomycetota bacterium]
MSLVVFGLLSARPAQANDPQASTETSDHSRALARLPLDSIQGPHRERVLEILKTPVLYRRGPVEAYPCHPQLLEWLMNHPVAVAEFWRQLGMLLSEVETIEGGYQCREGNTALVKFYQIHAVPNLRIVYCTGEASRPPLPGKLRAEIVYVYRYHFAKQPDGQYFVIQQIESYSTAPGATLKAVMKLTRAATNRLVDQSMQDMTIYFSLMCRVMQLRPRWTLEALPVVQAKLPDDEWSELSKILGDIVAKPVERPPLVERVAEHRVDATDSRMK